jgi:hypothetical protein
LMLAPIHFFMAVSLKTITVELCKISTVVEMCRKCTWT